MTLSYNSPVGRVGLMLLCASFWIGCEKKVEVSTGPVVLATVGSQIITPDDLKNEAARLASSNQTVPEKSVLLQQMVDRLILVERAKQMKLDVDHQTRRAMDGILISKLREKELDQKLAAIEVSEDELKKAYEADLASFTKSAKVRLSILFQQSNAKMSETKRSEIRKTMEEGLAKAQAAPITSGRGPAAGGFGTLSIQYSEEQTSRHRGGDIGWLDVGNFDYRWPKPVLEAGYALEKGKMSDIIEASDGLYVVMKTDFRESAAKPFSEAAPSLRRRLASLKQQSIEAAFIQESSAMVKSEIKSSALASIEIPSSPKLPVAEPESPPPSPPGVPVSAIPAPQPEAK